MEEEKLPLLFANGFSVNNSSTEIAITFSLMGDPQQRILLPIPIAKTLLDHLHFVLTEYESRTKQKILTLPELTIALAEKVENAAKE